MLSPVLQLHLVPQLLHLLRLAWDSATRPERVVAQGEGFCLCVLCATSRMMQVVQRDQQEWHSKTDNPPAFSFLPIQSTAPPELSTARWQQASVTGSTRSGTPNRHFHHSTARTFRG